MYKYCAIKVLYANLQEDPIIRLFVMGCNVKGWGTFILVSFSTIRLIYVLSGFC